MNGFNPASSGGISTLPTQLGDENLNRVVLYKTNPSRLALKGFEGNEYVWVRDTLISSTQGVNAQFSLTIDANGSSTGSSPTPNTKYWVYLQNGDIPHTMLACCATPPADFPYLATSGNGAKWRLVGSVKFDASTLIANTWHVGSYYHDDIDALLGAVSISGAETNDYVAYSYDDIMMMPGQTLDIEFQNNIEKVGGGSNNLTILKLFVDSVEKMGKVVYLEDVWDHASLGWQTVTTDSYAAIPSTTIELKVNYALALTSLSFPTLRNRVILKRKVI